MYSCLALIFRATYFKNIFPPPHSQHDTKVLRFCWKKSGWGKKKLACFLVHRARQQMRVPSFNTFQIQHVSKMPWLSDRCTIATQVSDTHARVLQELNLEISRGVVERGKKMFTLNFVPKRKMKTLEIRKAVGFSLSLCNSKNKLWNPTPQHLFKHKACLCYSPVHMITHNFKL